MTMMSTVKMPTPVRDRLRDQAKKEHITQSSLVEKMLLEREEAQFWARMAAAGAPTEAELDDIDAAFLATADDGVS